MLYFGHLMSIIFCTCGVIGNAKRKMSNYKYYTVFLLWMIITLVFEYLPDDDTFVNKNLDNIFGTHGIELVYRMSAAIASSFLFLALVTLMWPWTHHMFLGIFVVILIGFTCLFLWGIKSFKWIYGYRGFSRFVSFFYLVLQLMAFVDFSFWIHEQLVIKMDETNKRYRYTDKTCCCKNQWTSLYIVLSFLLFTCSIAACISFYFIFRVNGRLCSRNVIVITITLLMGCVITGFCLTEKINRGFLAPSTFFCIIVFYLLSALLTNSKETCNPYKSSSTFWISLINVLLNITSGYWMAFRIRNAAVDNPDTPCDDLENNKAKVAIPDEDSLQWSLFNACMAVDGIYLSMMCSAWYDGDIKLRTVQAFNFTSPWSFWVYNMSIWIGFCVFLYLILAPFIVKSRSY